MNWPSPTLTDALYLIPTVFCGLGVGLLIVLAGSRSRPASTEARVDRRLREAKRLRARLLRREERMRRRRRIS